MARGNFPADESRPKRDIKKETEVVNKIYEALAPLSPMEQRKVLQAVCVLMDIGINFILPDPSQY